MDFRDFPWIISKEKCKGECQKQFSSSCNKSIRLKIAILLILIELRKSYYFTKPQLYHPKLSRTRNYKEIIQLSLTEQSSCFQTQCLNFIILILPWLLTFEWVDWLKDLWNYPGTHKIWMKIGVGAKLLNGPCSSILW